MNFKTEQEAFWAGQFGTDYIRRNKGDAFKINADAACELAEVIPQADIHQGSILEFNAIKTFDLVLIKGALIHINPDALPRVYEHLYQSADRYLLVAEYYNRSAVAIPYRGHADRLFKRDFAGELLNRYPDPTLRGYGFACHRDPEFPQDDITWFLLERQN